MKASCRFCGLENEVVATEEQTRRIKESQVFVVEKQEDADHVIAMGFLQAHAVSDHSEETTAAISFMPHPTLYRSAFPGAVLDEDILDPIGCEVVL